MMDLIGLQYNILGLFVEEKMLPIYRAHKIIFIQQHIINASLAMFKIEVDDYDFYVLIVLIK